jgi:hypothetical protein
VEEIIIKQNICEEEKVERKDEKEGFLTNVLRYHDLLISIDLTV